MIETSELEKKEKYHLMFINVIKIQVVTKARPITNAALSLVRPGGRLITTLPFSYCFFSPPRILYTDNAGAREGGVVRFLI